MKTLIRYITIIISIYVLAAAALLVMCPLWSVIGFKVCACVSLVIGLTWYIPLILYIHTREQIDQKSLFVIDLYADFIRETPSETNQ